MENKKQNHENLAQFVGEWKTEGKVLADSTNPELEIKGIDTYDWLPGNHLLHTVDVMMGDQKETSFEIITYDEPTEKFLFRSFDASGKINTMEGIYEAGFWMVTDGFMRVKFSFSKDGNTLIGIWGKSQNGFDWAKWMDIKLTKK